jgi:hypothetical protein
MPISGEDSFSKRDCKEFVNALLANKSAWARKYGIKIIRDREFRLGLIDIHRGKGGNGAYREGEVDNVKSLFQYRRTRSEGSMM